MKKIGVITTSNSKNGSYGCNYGAALQGFALIQQLRLMGFEAYDINYLSENEYNPKQYNALRRFLNRLPLLFDIRLLKNKFQEYRNRQSLKINYEAFTNFVKKNNLTYNNGAFYNILELQEESSTFFAFITGSDVVWNPYLHKRINDDGYFLNFVPDGIKKIAYAPSIGVTKLPEESAMNLKELLEGFDSLSVREASGAKLIHDVTGLNIKVVLDPTMLLPTNEYESILQVPDNLPEHYIAVYRFGNITHTLEKIKEVSNKTGLEIVYIPSLNDGEFQPRYDTGPQEFLGIIKNSSLVLTDSFHCSIFSILYHKPFLTFHRTRPCAGKDINARMSDILALLGLESRMLNIDDAIDYSTLFDIDYGPVDQKLKELRQDSYEYLKNALS